MTSQPRISIALGNAEEDPVTVRGLDLTSEIVGKITFSEMTFLELVGRLPTPAEARMVDALLVSLAEHGLVSNVVAARLIYHSAPESIQGAVATSLLGAGSVHLGSSEYSAKMMVEAMPEPDPAADADALAQEVVRKYTESKTRIPGIGHRQHPNGDPRAQRLFEIATENSLYGPYCALIERISVHASDRAGRLLPVNVTGAIAAVALQLGLPWQMTKAFALIGRTLGALAHIGEEIRKPTTQTIDGLIRGATVYEPDRA